MPASPDLRALSALAVLLLASAAPAVSIVDGSELYTSGIGDYFAVAGNQDDSSPGLVLEVLGGSISGNPNDPESLQKNGSEDGTNSFAMGELYDILFDQGITSTSSLVFGIGINQNGSTCSDGTCNYVEAKTGSADTLSSDVNGIEFSFERPASLGGGTDVFDLGTDVLRIYNYAQGQSTAEAKIQIDLGFDFMTAYDTNSTEQFTISAFFDHTDDGFEIIFLSGGFTENPPVMIPEPQAVSLLALGLLAIGLRQKSARKRDPSGAASPRGTVQYSGT